MIRTMITATNTMGQLQEHLATIGNNLANVSTHGYKARESRFNELLYQQFNNDKLDRAQRQTPVGIRYGVGARIAQTQTKEKQGSLQSTGRDLDVSFTKERQYFNILMPQGDNGATRTVYSRQGNFYISPLENGSGMLVNADGYPVANAAGQSILVPNVDQVKDFTIDNNGQFRVNYANGNELAGANFALGVTEFKKPQFLEHVSGTYFGLPANMAQLGYAENEILTPLNGANRGQIGLQNRALEMSNVDMSKEMTDMIETQRSYQFNARAVTMGDQMLGLINGIR